MSDIDKKFYSWNEFDRDIKDATKRLAPFRHRLKDIYGIPRGGLVVAVALSHKLNLPLIFDKKAINNNTLVVDDISDSGATFRELLAFVNFESEFVENDVIQPITFSLHYSNKSKFKPDVWINKKKAWTVYPWETKESSKYDGTNRY